MSEREHELKTWPAFYEALLSGHKTFEVREDDRGFAVGDVLVLQEFDPELVARSHPGYTGREMRALVTYLMPGGRFGIDPRFVVMGILGMGRTPAPHTLRGVE